MTKLEKRKSRLIFETSDLVREKGKYRRVVFEVHPEFSLVRLAGLRTSFSVSHGAIYQFAAANAARAALNAKKEARKKKSGGR